MYEQKKLSFSFVYLLLFFPTCPLWVSVELHDPQKVTFDQSPHMSCTLLLDLIVHYILDVCSIYQCVTSNVRTICTETSRTVCRIKCNPGAEYKSVGVLLESDILDQTLFIEGERNISCIKGRNPSLPFSIINNFFPIPTVYRLHCFTTLLQSFAKSGREFLSNI